MTFRYYDAEIIIKGYGPYLHGYWNTLLGKLDHESGTGNFKRMASSPFMFTTGQFVSSVGS